MPTNSDQDPRVLVIGETLIDALPQREEVGGSPANVAVGLGRLSVPVRFHSAIGTDVRADRIAEHFRESGVEVTAQSRSLTTTSVAHVELDGEGAATYRFEIDSSLAPWDYRGEPIVHIGSLFAFLEPAATAVETFVKTLPPEAIVTFDPNIRAELIDDVTSARDRFARLCALSDIVKLSDEDARWLYPSSSESDVLTQIASFGPHLVALTRGAEGAVMFACGATVSTRPAKVPVVDTVGAGDTFMAALISCVVVGGLPATTGEVARIGDLAAMAAGVTVSRRGADLPWAEELPGFLPALMGSATRPR
ncbi:carbohydrate kinase family protein [Microbacterium sp. A204]|uniref:carbohydrate kinase family protein n=1 Tax=Microbacterium sp. A204 TaxID=3457321 RepID=UPI003FD14257